MHIIKKYANRKLYSTEDSCYITLNDIADLVTLREDFQVVDNSTGTDVTISVIQSAVAELALNKLNEETLKSLLIFTNKIDTEQENNYTNSSIN